MTRWAFVVDLNRCVGCQTCTSACKHENATAPGVQWRKVIDFETGTFPDVRRAFVPVGCMHCAQPSCMEVCPSTATRKRGDGIVTIDYDICIGCAYCAVACPYQARYKVDRPSAAYGGAPMRHEAKRENPARLGVAQKCTFCADRIDAGLAAGLTPGLDIDATPACAASCISGALAMGDLDDPASNVSLLLRRRRHFAMHEELGNGPAIHYLYDTRIAEPGSSAPPEMAAEPPGMAAISPQRQRNWDWRAAANFVLGGAGSGLVAIAALPGLAAPAPLTALFAGLALVAAGLLCVWLEIGRRWRFLDVLRNPRTSWMSREALAALPLLGLGGLAWLLGVAGVAGPGSLTGLLSVAGLCALVFLYCQARILRAAKGIPAWRQEGIVALVVASGLAEGAGLYALIALAAGAATAPALAASLAGLAGLRHFAWSRYREALGRAGAPAAAFAALDRLRPAPAHAVTVASALWAAMELPGAEVALALAGLAAIAAGWMFKPALILRAGLTQGYAINRMPARGAGTSGPGIQPGWVRA